MRSLLLIPVALMAVVGVGLLACRLLHITPAMSDLTLATSVALLASILAAVPIVLSRGASTLAAAQAGLVATALHLMAMIVAGGVVQLKIKPGPAFLYWLSAFYMTTLVAVAVIAIVSVKSAPTQTKLPPPQQP